MAWYLVWNVRVIEQARNSDHNAIKFNLHVSEKSAREFQYSTYSWPLVSADSASTDSTNYGSKIFTKIPQSHNPTLKPLHRPGSQKDYEEKGRVQGEKTLDFEIILV